jgi:hypothetical protein
MRLVREHDHVRPVAEQFRRLEFVDEREDLAMIPAQQLPQKRRKMRPRMGAEYSWDLRPELARNWSAASKRRFPNAALSVSF